MGINRFRSFPQLNVGVEGPQASIDLFDAMSSPTGLEPSLTFIADGGFTGNLSIEGSIDNAGWSLLAQFEAGLGATGNVGNGMQFSPLQAELVRRKWG